MLKVLTVAVVLVLVQSCAVKPTVNLKYLSQVPRNSILSLESLIQIPADRDRVYFQDGKLESSKRIKIEAAHCELEMKYREVRMTSLEPEEFRILSVTSEREDIERDFAKNKDKALFITTKLFLKSEHQTDILRISCSKLIRQNSGQVTLADFRSSVGKYLRIKFR